MKKFLHFLFMLAVPFGTVTAEEVTIPSPEAIAEVIAETIPTTPALANINGERIEKADQEPENWLAHGRTYSEQRYSPLDQINANNVKDLGLAWYTDLDTRRGLEASPIVVDGVMFTTGDWSKVYAVDARTGKMLWRYDPQVPKEHGFFACCDVVNRGVAVWEGQVYVGTIDGRLIALDAVTGNVTWDIQTTNRNKAYTITGAPRIVDGKVIIGNGGAEYGVRGYITAYDAKTGEQLWRFYTVPGNPALGFESPAMEMAAKTWTGEWWKDAAGGGTVWDSMAYDPDLNLLYIGVGNASPWNRWERSPDGGDNLFTSSIVAINPDDGSYVWHYQTTPSETWDYTATQHLILAELEIEGQEREVIMQAPKNGFFYVIDRKTGEFLSADNYVYVNWATGIDPDTGRPMETEKQYEDGLKITYPSPFGGHNWHPMAYNPNTNLVYIPALDIPFFYQQYLDGYEYNPKTWNVGLDLTAGRPLTALDGMFNKKLAQSLAKGHLLAWDPVAQKEAWRVHHIGSWNGGVLTTGGNLVIQGTADGKLAAYKADTGEKVWDADTHTGIIAPPITYMIDGEQYVTVMAGWGGAFSLFAGDGGQHAKMGPDGRILTYKIGGNVSLPDDPELDRGLPQPPEQFGSGDDIKAGNILFHEYCAACHGTGAVQSSTLPDLRYMSEITHQAFYGIVLGGSHKSRGMVSFSEVISEEETKQIHAYLIERAEDTKTDLEASSWWLKVKGAIYDVFVKIAGFIIGLVT